MGICILSEIRLSCSCVPDIQIAPYIKKSNAAFSLELVIPITWMGYSHHLGGLFPPLGGMGAVLLPQALLECTFHKEHCQLKRSGDWTLGTGMSSGDRKAPTRHVLESCLCGEVK